MAPIAPAARILASPRRQRGACCQPLIFQIPTQPKLRGAGGARTRDRRIMRPPQAVEVGSSCPVVASARMVPSTCPRLSVKPSTPRTSGATRMPGLGRAMTRRSSVLRWMVIPSAAASRAPARPASSGAICVSNRASGTLRLEHGTNSWVDTPTPWEKARQCFVTGREMPRRGGGSDARSYPPYRGGGRRGSAGVGFRSSGERRHRDNGPGGVSLYDIGDDSYVHLHRRRNVLVSGPVRSDLPGCHGSRRRRRRRHPRQQRRGR